MRPSTVGHVRVGPLRRALVGLFICSIPLVLSTASGAVALPAGSSADAVGPGQPRERQLSHQALVLFRPNTSRGQAVAIARAAGATVDHQVSRCWSKDGSRLMLLRSSTQSTQQLVDILGGNDRVVYAEPNFARRLSLIPNDLQFSELWGIQKIAATEAWGVATGSPEVVVADIDSGCDYYHPDLAANIWTNPGEYGKASGFDDDSNGYADDIHGIDTASHDSDPLDDDAANRGHGTHTAGTIGAVGDNGLGVAGVCWRVQIMPLKAFGGTDSGTTSAIIECINYALAQEQQGVNVVAINASYASPSYSQAERDAIAAVGEAGVVFVASAGNGGDDSFGDDNDEAPQYPASYDCSNIIAVAASGMDDSLMSFSNYGAASVALAAPGSSIVSTVPVSVEPSGYASYSGTSMATPYVTGAVALCAARYPNEDVPQRIKRILSRVDKVPSLAGRCASSGRLNLAKSLSYVGSPPLMTFSSRDNLDLWHNHDILVSFSVSDPDGDGEMLLYSYDQSRWLTSPLGSSITTLRFPAESDHSRDGDTLVYAKARDAAGHEETATHSFHVKIDTVRPATRAPSTATARRGRTVMLRYRVLDALPNGGTGTVAIKVKNRRGKLMKTLRLGVKPVNTAVLTAKFKVPRTWRAGSYRFFVYAVDAAGNAQSRVGSNRIRVR